MRCTIIRHAKKRNKMQAEDVKFRFLYLYLYVFIFCYLCSYRHLLKSMFSYRTLSRIETSGTPRPARYCLWKAGQKKAIGGAAGHSVISPGGVTAITRTENKSWTPTNSFDATVTMLSVWIPLTTNNATDFSFRRFFPANWYDSIEIIAVEFLLCYLSFRFHESRMKREPRFTFFFYFVAMDV